MGPALISITLPGLTHALLDQAAARSVASVVSRGWLGSTIPVSGLSDASSQATLATGTLPITHGVLEHAAPVRTAPWWTKPAMQGVSVTSLLWDDGLNLNSPDGARHNPAGRGRNGERVLSAARAMLPAAGIVSARMNGLAAVLRAQDAAAVDRRLHSFGALLDELANLCSRHGAVLAICGEYAINGNSIASDYPDERSLPVFALINHSPIGPSGTPKPFIGLCEVAGYLLDQAIGTRWLDVRSG